MRGLIVILAALACANLPAAIVTLQPADTVLGQPDFSSTSYLMIPSATRLTQPVGVAVDPTTGKIFVSEPSNNRVLRYASSAAMSAGAAAEAVLGQVDFVSSVSAANATGMNEPGGLVVDASGALWVGDIFNHRLLRFNNASAKATGAAADGVLGQPNFTSSTATNPPTAASISSAFGLAITSSGTLWVADFDNDRVLGYVNASAKANGAAADVEFGQANFAVHVVPMAPTNANVSEPAAVAVDTADHLWVADSQSNRVLRYDHVSMKAATGATADAVLGQPTFTTSFAITSRYGLRMPLGVGVDSAGTLWVSSTNDNRVLGFFNPGSLPNGALADVVLGQPAFDVEINYIPARAYSLSQSQQICGDTSGDIWIADTGNNRILRFASESPSTPASPTAPPIVTISGGKSVTTAQTSISLHGKAIGGAGIAKVEYRVGNGAFRNARGTSSWTFQAKLKPGKNVVTVRAIDAQGRTSSLVKITVQRK